MISSTCPVTAAQECISFCELVMVYSPAKYIYSIILLTIGVCPASPVPCTRPLSHESRPDKHDFGRWKVAAMWLCYRLPFCEAEIVYRCGVESICRRLRTGGLNFVSAGKGILSCPRVQSACDCTPDDVHKERSYPSELEMSQGMWLA
jgi:hypothetical protein